MIRKATFLIAGIAIGALAAIAVTQPRLLTGAAANAAGSETFRALNLFGNVFERVRADYVEVPEDSQLVESAINGMLAGLDPHSSYLSPKSFRDMQVQTSGKFGGLGIEVTMEDGVIKVVSPIDDTPAWRAGIISGDLIIALDGVTVRGMTLSQAVERMRGDIDEPISLSILREGVENPFTVEVIRAEIIIQAVRSRVEDKIGYLRISSFSEQVYDGLKAQIAKLRDEIGADEIQGYIIDLRNNPGGLLDQAIAASDAFLERGEVVSTRGRRADEAQRYNAHAGDLTDGKPIIVLVNGGSASASEIVAGALQDHGRATILGTKTFGKGSVQTIIPLGSNGALRLTTARYYTPSGESIQAQGIDPDIKVIQELPPEIAERVIGAPRGEAGLLGHLTGEDEDAAEQSGSLAYVPPDPKDDKQLKYALDLLRGLEADAAFPPDPNRGIPN